MASIRLVTERPARVLQIEVTLAAEDAEHVAVVREAAVRAAREAAREAGATIVSVSYGTRPA